MIKITLLATMETMALMASAVASSPLGLTTTEEPRYLVVGTAKLLIASVEDPHQAPASQVPDGPLLVCSNVSPLGHIGYSVFLKHPK